MVERAEFFAGNPEWNVLKRAFAGDHLSLLTYEAFFDKPFPELARTYRVDLATEKVELNEYPAERNRPILHRKELLLHPDHPRWLEFASLSRALDDAGLLRDAHLIGYREQWNARLRSRGYVVIGHSLERLDGLAEVPEAVEVERHRTALTRYGLSSPMQALARNGFLDGSQTVFDYGCGKGDDLRLLDLNGIDATGWDPYYRPDSPKSPASIVNLGFVVNVIEDPEERVSVVTDAFSLAEYLLVVSVMLDSVAPSGGRQHRDGFLTARNTFQKYYTQAEFQHFLSSALDIEPIAVGPGVFFVFCNEGDAEEFLERRSANRGSLSHLRQRLPRLSREEKLKKHYDEHAGLLEPLWALYLSLGREPTELEVPALERTLETFGTLKKALRFLARYHGDELIAEAAASRTSDLRVYLALQQFARRQGFRGYSERLKRDIKVFFGSLRNAMDAARALLFSIGDPENIRSACLAAAAQGIGVLSDDSRSLTVHSRFLNQLPERLRVYVGCATNFYGDPEAADLIKVHIDSGKLTLMMFDDFEGQPLPRMTQRVKLDFRHQAIDVFEYGDDYECPYLFLKSRFINEEFVNFEEQQEFDERLLALGHFDFDGYGPKPQTFRESLKQLRLTINGFELTDASDIPDLDDRCGKYFRYRDLIECGETQQKTGIPNAPSRPETFVSG